MPEITVKLVRKINSAGWAMFISTITAMLTKTNLRIHLQTLKSSCYKCLPEDERQGSAPDWGKASCNTGDTWDIPSSVIPKFYSASVANLEHNQSPEIYRNLICLMLLIQSRHVMVTVQTTSFCHSRVQVCHFSGVTA